MHTLSHELVHILIFSYLITYLNFPPCWVNVRFGRGYILPDECKIPKNYIELLYDTIGVTSQYENINTFLNKWEEKWDPNNYSIYGEYYFSKNHQWAIEFIRTQSKNVHGILFDNNNLISRTRRWKKILEFYFKSYESEKRITEVLMLF
ncbi:MAG: hypothetical protein ACFE96_18745 [Candidatus Hermodarchaeota archaeon]